MDVVLEVDGLRHLGWTDVSVTRSIRQAASQFSLSVTERWVGQSERWQIRPGQACTLTVPDPARRVVTGYVTGYAPSFSGRSRGVRIAGASRTVDLADCSAVVPGGQFRGYTLDAIARALLRPFGVALDLRLAPGAPFASVAVTPGEEVAALLTRLSADRGAIFHDDAEGRAVIGLPASGRSTGRLVEGETVLEGSANLDVSDRYSEYIFKGQAFETDGFHGAPALTGQGRATDLGVTRYRPLIVTPSGDQVAASLTTRAAHERDRRLAAGVTATVTVQGWEETPGGALWDVNRIVPVWIPSIGLQRDMLIETVTLTRSRGAGTVASLDLILPEAVDVQSLATAAAASGANSFSWAGLQPVE
ncbi:phage baseplate assembly protein [Pacificispira sp.]|uniref:phage baseplate assembly protein n=1 Tax=Pacificispira sp. TaxID=2888761 RepID=UPI003BA8F2ED